MDRLLIATNAIFGKSTIYQRPGFAPFTIVGIPDYKDRLEDPSRGQFYAIFYRAADFINAPFTATCVATFSGPPNGGGTVTFDGITYTSVVGLNNAVPYQFLRGSSALGAASNLSACINAELSSAGVFFSSATTAHPTCTAAWQDNGDGTGSTIVSAIVTGAAGNKLRAVDHMSFLTLSSVAFDGGLPIDNDLITIEDILYRVSDVPEPDSEGGIHLRLEQKAL